MCEHSWRVPSGVRGRLTFIATCDIGNLGPTDGRPLYLDWRPAIGYGWLYPVLAGAVLLVRGANLNRRSARILTPWLMSLPFACALIALDRWRDLPKIGVLGWAAYAQAMGTAIFWIFAVNRQNRSRIVSLLWLLLTLAAVAFFSGGFPLILDTAYLMSGLTTGLGQPLAITRMLVFLHWVSPLLALAGWMAIAVFGRARLSIGRCLAFYFLTVLIAAIGGQLLFVLFTLPSGASAAGAIAGGLLDGAAWAAILFISVLPLLLFLLVNEHYRYRLLGVLFPIRA